MLAVRLIVFSGCAMGPHRLAEVGPLSAISREPTAAARCIIPVFTLITNFAFWRIAASSPKLVVPAMLRTKGVAATLTCASILGASAGEPL